MNKNAEARLLSITRNLEFITRRLESAGWGLTRDNGSSLWYTKEMTVYPDDNVEEIDFNIVGVLISVNPDHFSLNWRSFGIQNIDIDLYDVCETKVISTFEVQSMLSYIRKAEDELLEAGIPFSGDYSWFIGDKEAKTLRNQEIRKAMRMDELEAACWKELPYLASEEYRFGS